MTHRRLLVTVLRALACLGTAALLAFGLSAPLRGEAARAATLRRSYRYGSDVAAHVVRESVTEPVEEFLTRDVQIASANKGLISDHDLYMLQKAAELHISRDEGLAQVREATRLPVRYSYLDGFDTDVLCFKKALRDELPQMVTPDFDAQVAPLGFGVADTLASWHVAPVLLGLRASPSARDCLSQVIADDVALSLHTAGQVTPSNVREWGFRYAIACVRDDPKTREEEIAALEGRVREIAAEAEEAAGDDDAAYVRAAFDILSRTISYAEDSSSSVHFNDAYGALVEGSARCYGLSGALKMVLDLRGIPNYIANGSKADGRHSWNVVCLGGAWRVCDLTLMVDAREGDAGLSADPAHRGIYACLELEHNFYAKHGYVLDDECKILQLVYSGVVRDLFGEGARDGA